jgi:hypothetical protein
MSDPVANDCTLRLKLEDASGKLLLTDDVRLPRQVPKSLAARCFQAVFAKALTTPKIEAVLQEMGFK